MPLLTERQKLLRDYGPDHPKVQAVQESIETVVAFYRSRGVVVPEGLLENVHPRAKTGPETTQQEGLFAAYLESLRQQLAELDYRDKQLAELHARESKLAKELARYQAQDQTFHDDIARIKALWDVVVRRLNELNLIKNSQGYTLKQIAPVRVKLLTKRIIKFLGAGLFCGLGLVVSLIVFQERRDTTLKTVDEIQHAVRSPVLGAVPRFDAGPVTAEDADSLGAALCYYYRPASLEAEAYRSIRTTLLSQLAETGRKVIQVSSPEPGDGKTTLACNLALAIAQTGKRVLLIDADLRRPRIHALFGLDREVGLVEVVGREIDLLTAAKETAVPNLFVLTAGTAVAQPAELLSDVGLAEMLAVARREFDIVLIDAPPVLIVSDTCIIAQHTDGLLLVLQVGKNRRATVKRALERLQANHIPVLGAIANALDAKSEDGYGYGYGYEDAYVDYASPAVGEDQSATVDPPGPAAPDEPGEMISANAASPRL
ncbi:MAG: polysaccharide biosynthesis tyrosine autokinase [Planctomycetes bacterium]|nr:polysaccharide biosynthesis tyrosine autokinase [Planctomycetota bacterium]